MNWSENQLKAIDTRSRNILVSAAAGSGKTALLIERIVRLILIDGIDVSELLVMTFTRAAAAEMKGRLKKKLTEALSEHGTDTQRILEQLHQMNTASISTLDAFCTAFLRENFQSAGISPDFSMGSEGELKVIRQEVLEDVLESYYAAIPEKDSNNFAIMAEMFSNYKNDTQLKDLIIKLHTFLSTLPDPDGWCKKALDHFKWALNFPKCNKDFFETEWGRRLRESISADCKRAKAFLNTAYDDCTTDPIFYKLSVIVANEIDQITVIEEALSRGAEAYFEIQKEISFAKFNTPRKLEDDQKQIKEMIKNNRNESKKIISDLAAHYGNSLEKIAMTLSAMAKPVATLLEVTSVFSKAYFDRKCDEDLLDFADVERLTLQVLQNNEEIRKSMNNKYSHVFLDEYQDTNGMQEAIISCIVREDNYFMVGDVKQSIYRFRLADPGIFINKYHRFKKEMESDDSKNILIALSQNYRSGNSVIHGVNAIFEQIMSTNLGEVDYDDLARLYPGIDRVHPDPLSVKTEIHLVETESYQDDESDEAVLSSDVEQEAKHIANEIQKLIGRDFYFPRENGGNGLTRPLQYKDIGILMRAVKGRASVFKRVFNDAGIPLYFDGDDVYYNTFEISLVLNVLRLMDNPARDLPLLSVLLSPIGGFTTTECARIKALIPDTHYFYEAFWQYPQVCETQDEISEKILALKKQLSDWRFECGVMDLEAFLWKLYRDTGIYTFVGGLKGGEQRRSNLRQLLTKAQAYKRTTMKGLFHFLRFVDHMNRQNVDDLPPGILDENDDVVRMMTIHKSKGLEFPVVFVAGLNKHFNTDTLGDLSVHKDLGICPKYINLDTRQKVSTVAHQLCKQVVKRESLSEEMRLLYVAMTRAEEKLFLVGSVNSDKKEKTIEKWHLPIEQFQLENAKTLLDWVMMAAVNREDIFDIKWIREDEPIHCGNTESFKERSLISIQDLHKKLSWEYPYQDELVLPEKMTVTAIKKYKHSGKTLIPEITERMKGPEFMEQDPAVTGFTGAEIGTGVHLLLSEMDLSKLAGQDDVLKIVHAQADRMVAEHKMLPALRERLPLKKVASFLKAPIGKRLVSAKTVWREKTFNYLLPAHRILEDRKDHSQSVLIQGMIDCCFMEEDAWVLLDYKTDYYNTVEDMERLKDLYVSQLSLYGEALEAITGIAVGEKFLILLHKGDYISL